MNKNNLYTLTIEEAQIKSNNGDITSVELTQSVLDRVMSVEHAVNGYISTQPELALQMAQEADKRRASGENTPLLGIPIAIKDSIVTKNVTTTSGSKILENFVPPYDATVVKKLREAGAVFIGKTNTDEFTMGSSTEFSAFGTTHNPWNLDCVPGGSSGGSAAVVSAQEALGALGTDTGGSIRQPASFCGIVGLKPTYGRVSRYGLIAHGSSLDQIGPLTRTVMDSAILLQVIAGHDFLDSTTLNSPVPDYLSKLKARSFDGIKIGVPKEYFIEGNLTSGVDSAIREALKHVESMGATLIDVSLPHTKYAIPTYYLIAMAETSSNLSRYDGVRYGLRVPAESMIDSMCQTRATGFGTEVKRRIMLGTYVLSAGYYDAYYIKAQKVRTLIRRDFENAFKQVDVIFCPTSPSEAFKIGQKIDDPLQMYFSDIFTVMANLAGICGISIPCGFGEGNLPVGLQILGPALGEDIILQIAYAYEQATEWYKYYPSLAC